MGYQTSIAKSLKEGYDKYNSFSPDVVLLDLSLPDGSGFSAIPGMKEANPDVKIVIVSAYDGPKERKRASLEGADFFIGKPFSLHDIREYLSAALNRN